MKLRTWFTSLALAMSLGWALPAAGDGNEDDYGRSRIGGNKGPISWESLLSGDGLTGWRVTGSEWPPSAWTRDGETLVCDDTAGTHAPRLVQGDSTWAQYEFKVQATPVRVSTMEIHFGLSEDGNEYYSLNYLSGWGAVAISRRDATGLTKLDVVNHVLHFGQEYDVVLAIRGHSITSYINGQLVNRLTVDTPVSGPIGLVVWGKHGVARFREPKIRHYN
jgi:hypothetical protein